MQKMCGYTAEANFFFGQTSNLVIFEVKIIPHISVYNNRLLLWRSKRHHSMIGGGKNLERTRLYCVAAQW